MLLVLKIGEVGAQIGISICVFFGFYIIARLSIILPATAVDQKKSMSWAFHEAVGNGWRLVLIVLMIPTIIYWITDFLPRNNVLLHIAIEVLLIVVWMIEIVALSLSYKYLMGNSLALTSD